jgi:hypothetical protein
VVRGRIRRIVAAERPGLVECCDKYTLNYLAALLRRGWLGIRGYRPVVVGLSCERMDENVASNLTASPPARRFCRWYMRWLYFPMFDHHIANSARTADELKQVSEGHRVRRGAWVSPMGAAERFDWSAVASSFFALYAELSRVAHSSRAESAIEPAFYSTYPVTRGRFGWNS